MPVRRVDRITVQTKAHQDGFRIENAKLTMGMEPLLRCVV
jgi:hypothetical protein